MKFMLNKQTGVFILREDMFDRISRQAKAEVGGEIAGERAKEKLEASKKASEFLNSIDRVRDNYIQQLYNKKQSDKPSYFTMIPLLVKKNISENFLNSIKSEIDKVNNEFKPFFTQIKNKQQVDYNQLINSLQTNLKNTTARVVFKEAQNTNYQLNKDVISKSIIKNYVAFLINETLLNGLSDQDKKNVFGDDTKFKNFQSIFSKFVMPTDEENNVYEDTLKYYNIVKNNLKTKSPEEAKQQHDQEQEEIRKQQEEKRKEEEEIKKQKNTMKLLLVKFIELVNKLLKLLFDRNQTTDGHNQHTYYKKLYDKYELIFSKNNLKEINEAIPQLNKDVDNLNIIINGIEKNNTNRNLKESKILKEYREEINNLLIPHMQKQLGFNHPPTINFAEDQNNAEDMVGKTGYYDPSTKEITVFITNRHPKDIMRTVAHEVIHHAQNERGDFDNLGEMGEGYFQTNPHLHKLEIEAYSSGNDLFRKWEENFRKQRNQNNMVNENNLRAKIRSLIEAEMKNMADEKNEPAKEHDASCECEECAKKKTFLKNKGVKNIAESVDKEVMPLKEWRNMELNSLLLNRFGIVSPQVLGEKKNKKPDADGDGVPDWADKKPKDPKVGAKKTPTKKGKIPPQFLKDKKKDESK